MPATLWSPMTTAYVLFHVRASPKCWRVRRRSAYQSEASTYSRVNRARTSGWCASFAFPRAVGHDVQQRPQRRDGGLHAAVVEVAHRHALLRLDLDKLAEQDWDCVVLDEAQTIKNPTSQVAQAAIDCARRRARATATSRTARFPEESSGMRSAPEKRARGAVSPSRRFAPCTWIIPKRR
ncbi:MAG: hypothetical protein HC882_06035 [Acidobacteria bacterium]|nr:hypothetical protein [Acidobacteriota bacterium]